jgi:hypothetical protein
MLIKNAVLDEIRNGRISLIFRRWKKAGVKAGGAQLTQAGLLAIDAVDVVQEKQITEQDAGDAGFAAVDDLLSSLYDRDEGCEIYRIRVRWAGEDPRKLLRQSADLSDTEIGDIIGKLRKLDANSRRGKWTQMYLQMIYDQPNTHAAILAEQIGLDIPHFKPWVRKLKALGLTESLRPGYRLSERGKRILKALHQDT